MNISEVNQIYNVSSGVAIEFRYPVEYCKKLLGSTSQINYLPNKVNDYYLNTGKIKKLGFELKTPLEKGLRTICLN